jgi:hypothetical protein
MMAVCILCRGALVQPVSGAGPANPPVGFQGASWGMSAAEVRQNVDPQAWNNVTGDYAFPEGMDIAVYASPGTVAGYDARITYYFIQDNFFQATVQFDFSGLANYDFNYNVYRSVNEYYNAIRSRTLTFVHDIFDLLRKKYGKKEPVFEGLDPRNVFVPLDEYVNRERWNLRYHPYDFYQSIVTSAYARWLFPETRVIFSTKISAPDKRFDYTLSLSSLDYAQQVNELRDRLRMQDL